MSTEAERVFGDVAPDVFVRTCVLLVIAVTCVTGIFTLSITFLVMRKVEVFHTPFGVLMQGRCIHSILLLLIFLLWVVPNGVLGLEKRVPLLNNWIGLMSLFFNTGVFLSTAGLSFLRFLNVTIPSSGEKSKCKYSHLANVLILIISGIYAFPFSLEGCSFYYDSDVVLFYFSNTPCGNALSLYGDCFFSLALFTVAMFFDGFTVYKLRNARKKIAGSLTNIQMQKRYKREFALSWQTATNVGMCFAMTLSYHYLSSLFQLPYIGVFISSRYLWCFVIAAGGYASVLFNREVRQFIRAKIFCCSSLKVVQISNANNGSNRPL